MVFKESEGFSDLPVTLPCNQCIGCRLEHSRQWAVRCVHEASMFDKNCFVTLTYNDEHLPDDWSLNKADHQKFMKRLRKKFIPKNPYNKKTQPYQYNEHKSTHRIPFFHCGEYGDKGGRPHFHYCMFNHDFKDKILWQVKNDVPLYTSKSLSTLWSKGFCTIGDVTFASAAYVARYIMKKVTGEQSDDHYLDPETGVILKPEYTTMSRNPGLGKGWITKYQTDVFPCDNVVLNGKTFRPPKYYDTQYEIVDEKQMAIIKGQRVRNSKKHKDNNTPLRLKTRHRIQQLKLERLKRKHDD